MAATDRCKWILWKALSIFRLLKEALAALQDEMVASLQPQRAVIVQGLGLLNKLSGAIKALAVFT